MNNKNINLVANKFVKAFLKNKIISPIPINTQKKLLKLINLENLCESKMR